MMNILPEHKLLISDVRQNGSGPIVSGSPRTRILGSVADEPSGRRLDLGADRGDVVVGLALFGVLLIVAALTTDVGTAAVILILVVVAYVCLALKVAVVRRSLRRGISDAARWTFGFVGRWFSF
jgi:urea transporter